jgi:hypothetical protein
MMAVATERLMLSSGSSFSREVGPTVPAHALEVTQEMSPMG